MREMKDSGIEWLGEIPAGWGVAPGKRILTLLQRPVEDNDGVVTCFRDGEVTLRANRRTEGFTIALKEIGYQGVEPGDLVVHGMDGFAGSIGISDSRGKASPVLNVMDSDQNKRFLMYYMRGLAYRDVYMALSDGIRVRSCNLSWKKISNLPFALPPLPVQRRIADFLDEKCAEVDRAVSAAENSIEEYKAYKNSVVFQAVTKGLDSDVPMADSGLDWIGCAPKHWDVLEQKWLMRKKKSICEKWQGESVLSLTIGGVIVRDVESGKGKFPATFDGYQYIDAGNLVLCLFDIDVTPRCVGLARRDGVISPAYSQFAMLPGAEARFYDYYLRAMDDRKLYLGLTSTMRHSFTADAFGLIHALRPPVDEQLRIVNYLDAKTAEIDRLVLSKQAIIADLKAYKQSLIYEAVTGKREV